MSGRVETFLIEPDKWAFEAEEARVDEERLRGLILGPDPVLTDYEAMLALFELLHAEVAELAAEDYGILSPDQVALAFDSLFATARRIGWTPASSQSSPTSALR